MLRQRALDERRDVALGIAHGTQPVRHLEPLHEPRDAVGQHRAGVGLVHAGDVGAQGLRGVQVPRGLLYSFSSAALIHRNNGCVDSPEKQGTFQKAEF